ncbi:putative solute carrier family 22 member 31 [Paramormyrops kingsleyae]|nr:putative solute carrier family 22 member 31 isoform X1 [Paramormyrops kingsleyae]
MDFESRIFPRIGAFGRYNRIVVFFTWIPNFAVAFNLFSNVFFTLIPESYHCAPDPSLLPAAWAFSNLSEQESLNFTIPWVKGSGLSHCELYKYPANFTNFTDNMPREAVACTRGWEYTEAAGLHSNYVTQWNLVCGNSWKIPLQHVCFMLGWILGYVLLGSFCDRFGRRRGFLLSIGLSGSLGVAVCLARGPLIFLLLRLCQGAALSGAFLSAYITRLEICDPPHRLMMTMIGGFFAVGAELLLPGVAVLCRDWPVLQAVATLPLLLLLSYWCCASRFPESPRWFLATYQISQAKKALQNISTQNKVFLGEEIYPAESLLSEIDVAYPEDSPARYHHILELWHTRIIWRNCLILGFTLFIGTGIQYCFTRNLHSFSPNFYFSYFLRVVTGAAACVLLCLSVERFGRRGVLLLSAIVTGLSSLLLLALTQYLQSALVLLLSAIGLLASQALAMLSVFFGGEVMPTVVRGGALGLVLGAGCVGMAASSLIELQNNGGYFLYHVVFASFAVLSVLCVMQLPESKRKPLPDSLRDGENQRRPPLFPDRDERDALPLLRTPTAASDYDPESYSRLVTATKKMLGRERPYMTAASSHCPLLATDAHDAQEEKALHKESS